jgi:N,N'-diacetylchitobiose transport system permease protein
MARSMRTSKLPGGIMGSRPSWTASIVGAVILVIMAFPIYWMVITALKPKREILSATPTFFPSPITLDNFTKALDRDYFWSSVGNSLIVTISVVVLSMVVGMAAALAVAWMPFKGRGNYIVGIILVQMIPLTALVIPVYLMLNQVGLTDALVGVILTYLAFVLPFSIWTLRGFISGIPREIEEAATIDGASRFQTFRMVLLPLIAPGLVATSVFAFIQAWNEYILAYVLLSSQDKQTVTVWLAGFTTSRGTDWGPLMAASILVAVPVVVFFLIVQGRMASGLTAGAVKG